MSVPVRPKITAIVIIILLTISTVFTFFFVQSQYTDINYHFTIECRNSSSIRIIENITFGKFDITFSETNDSFWFLFSFQMNYTRIYAHQNISFKLIPRYYLGNGHYAINESVAFESIGQRHFTCMDAKT